MFKDAFFAGRRIGAMTALLLGSLALLASASAQAAKGEATWYTYSGNGNCSFPVPDGVYTAAMNADQYNTAQACGGLIKVTDQNNGKSILVRVDDQCPECTKGNLDLTYDAFSQLEDPNVGIIPIKWSYVENDVSSIKLIFKDGSSQWWTAVQVRDHRYRVKSMAYRLSGSGDSYQTLQRQDYNYFIKPDGSGMGTGPYDFKIKDINGQTIKIKNVPLVIDTEIDTGKQFPVYDADAAATQTPARE